MDSVIESILQQLPYAGVFFERTYQFWTKHILLANLTHVVLGIGIGLLLRKKKGWGFFLILIGIVMHVIAFVG